MLTSLLGRVSIIIKHWNIYLPELELLQEVFIRNKRTFSWQKKIKIIFPVSLELDIEEEKYFYPIMDNVKTHQICMTTTPFKTNGKGFIGKFYVMVVYYFGSNLILSKQIKKAKQRLSVLNFSKCTRYSNQD